MKTLPLFHVVGHENGMTAYYCGWWHTYGQPLLAHHPSLGAKAMTRSNANRVRRRLESPDIWGGEWRLVEVCASARTSSGAELSPS